MSGLYRRGAPALSQIANAAVALHREQFGRGPGSARTVVVGDLVICLMRDVFTPLERTLIEAGQSDRVLETRALHQRAVEEEARARMGEVLGRPVDVSLGAVHIESDLAIFVFVLAASPG
jgi:uncharacterized protein YbcI